jgi:predicted small secreted protein
MKKTRKVISLFLMLSLAVSAGAALNGTFRKIGFL